MDTLRIWTLMALLVIVGFATGNADADDAEFDFRFDEPSDGEVLLIQYQLVKLKIQL